MNRGKLVFAQIMEHLPLTTFRRCVARYDGEHKVKRFSCLDQYLCMAFAQLTWRESLRDIEACLRAQSNKLYHLGIRGNVARNTLANANATRDWRIYCDFAQSLIGIARRLYAEEPLGIESKDTVYALDSTTIDLCLSVFSWAPFRSTKAAVKLHTLLDLRGSIPSTDLMMQAASSSLVPSRTSKRCAAIRIRSTETAGLSAIKPLCSLDFTPARGSNRHCAASSSTIQKPGSGSFFSPTTSFCQH